jgi:hypothetical protein
MTASLRLKIVRAGFSVVAGLGSRWAVGAEEGVAGGLLEVPAEPPQAALSRAANNRAEAARCTAAGA